MDEKVQDFCNLLWAIAVGKGMDRGNPKKIEILFLSCYDHRVIAMQKGDLRIYPYPC